MKYRSKKHLQFVASLPCTVCGFPNRSQAAHIRSGNLAGTALKSGDDCTLPLCATFPTHEGCHDKQGRDETGFWDSYGGVSEASRLAKKIYENSGNREKCIYQIVKFRMNRKGF